MDLPDTSADPEGFGSVVLVLFSISAWCFGNNEFPDAFSGIQQLDLLAGMLDVLRKAQIQ